MRNLFTSAAVSFVATMAVLLAIMFFLGSYTYVPTAAAASLSGVPVSEQAAWITAHTKVVHGVGYASFIATDPQLRSAVISSAALAFAFGLVCAYASGLLQRRRRIAI